MSFDPQLQFGLSPKQDLMSSEALLKEYRYAQCISYATLIIYLAVLLKMLFQLQLGQIFHCFLAEDEQKSQLILAHTQKGQEAN